MEGILALVGFSLGASLGAKAVKVASGGLRPLARQLIRAGLAVGDAVQGVATQAASVATELAADVEKGANDLSDEATTETDRPRSIPTRKRTGEPRRISIARE